ncbi:MAG TPA: glycosyltransferase [Acidimicrobiia bacterium]
MTQPTPDRPSIGFASTYPPTACGLATFTAALRGAMASNRGSERGLGVVSLVEDPLTPPRPEVEYQHLNGDAASLHRAVQVLGRYQVAVLQHEYGIFGGPDGEEVLALMAGLQIPTIVTLHTVLSNPTPRQKEILERIVALSGRTVVMSYTAMRRLTDRYEVDPHKVQMVPHGASMSLAGPAFTRSARPVVLTWGLIGPGKGLETAIEAFAALKDIDPRPRYRILGRTHPKVQAAQGDVYLDGLRAMAHDLDLDDVVEFDGRYLDTESLVSIIRHADIALLPYQSTEQVTSGVLVEAIAAGKPVVATDFPHAVEMLGTGAGALVPHSDPEAIAASLRTLLTEPGVAAGMAQVAAAIGATLHWPVVAEQYESIASALLEPERSVAALPIRSTPDDLARVG